MNGLMELTRMSVPKFLGPRKSRGQHTRYHEQYGWPNVSELKRRRADESNEAIRPGAFGSVWTLDLAELRRALRVAIKMRSARSSKWKAGNANAELGAGIDRGLRRRQSTIADMVTFKTV